MKPLIALFLTVVLCFSSLTTAFANSEEYTQYRRFAASFCAWSDFECLDEDCPLGWINSECIDGETFYAWSDVDFQDEEIVYIWINSDSLKENAFCTLATELYTSRPHITWIELPLDALHNPLMWSDPGGESVILTCIVIGVVAGAVAGGLYGNHKANQAGHTIQSGGWDYWQYPLGYGAAGAAGGALLGWGVGAGYAALTASSPWLLNATARGVAIERMLGGMNNNFPVIDKFVKGANNFASSITSIKSMDLLAKSYQSGNTVYNTVMKYGNSLANFTSTQWANITVNVNSSTQRILELAIPPGATQAQINQIYKAGEELVKKGVSVIVKIIN